MFGFIGGLVGAVVVFFVGVAAEYRFGIAAKVLAWVGSIGDHS